MPTIYPETATNSTPSDTAPLQLRRFKTGGFYYAVFSDIHFGHNRNPASRIAANWMLALPDDAETASLDVIFIAGDLFDNLMMFNDADIFEVKLFISYLLKLCKKHNIKLRILEGTPLHDRAQSKYVPMENQINEIGADLKYIDTIDIEYIEDLGIHVLYIPDEPPGGSGPTLHTVKDLLRARGIEQVDIAIMHGLFRFQIEYVDSSITHDEQEYLKIVKHNISIGHDHTAKSFEQDGHGIYVQGSFDRLGHGYETPKGHMRFKWMPDGSWQVRFIENTRAMRFDTLDCTGLSLEDTYALINQRVGELPDFSHIRIKAEAGHPVFSNMEVLLRMAPLLNWKKEPVRDKTKAIAPVAETDTRFVPIRITPDNIASLILEKIASEGASGAIMDASVELLQDLFGAPPAPTRPALQPAWGDEEDDLRR
jgi:hypothetical protein